MGLPPNLKKTDKQNMWDIWEAIEGVVIFLEGFFNSFFFQDPFKSHDGL